MASHIRWNILYLCFAIREGVAKCAAVYETTNRIHEIHTSLHCLFYICVFVCRTRERKFAGQSRRTSPLETCVSSCTITSWRERGTPLPRSWEKYTLVVLTFIVDVVAFERVQCKKKYKKKQPKLTQKEGESFETDNTYILQGVNGWHAFLGMKKKKAHQKLVCYTADVLDVRASQWELCFVCAYVCACVCAMAETKKCQPLYIYMMKKAHLFSLFSFCEQLFMFSSLSWAPVYINLDQMISLCWQ